MKRGLVVLLALSLSACSLFGGKKTRLVPQAYMPEPPSILMQAPKELQTIKKQPVNTGEAPKQTPEGGK